MRDNNMSSARRAATAIRARDDGPNPEFDLMKTIRSIAREEIAKRDASLSEVAAQAAVEFARKLGRFG
jgi:hypothetical protein